MPKLLAQIADSIDTFSEWTGRLVSWLVVILVAIICYDVAVRYLLREGSVALQEWQWHLFALMFLLGAAYTLKHDEHVRVDIVYQSRRVMNDRRRAWVNLLGTLLFLYPFAVLIIVSSWPFVRNAFMIGEGSPDPGGLPYRYLLKAAIPVCFALLVLQGLSMIIRNVLLLRERGGQKP